MTVEYSLEAEVQFLNLEKPAQRQIRKYLEEVSKMSNPRARGKALKGNLSSLWRYRTGDWRIICEIQDTKIMITVLRIGNRKKVYR